MSANRQADLSALGGLRVLRGVREASRMRRGPVALWPRLSPGVPLSWDGKHELRVGTGDVNKAACDEKYVRQRTLLPLIDPTVFPLRRRRFGRKLQLPRLLSRPGDQTHRHDSGSTIAWS
jgi:hypothetical protein